MDMRHRTNTIFLIMALAVQGILVMVADGGQADTLSIREEKVRFKNGTTELAASLLLPAGNGQVPAVVIIHGPGSNDRRNSWTHVYANGLLAKGIAVLYPDKRGAGESSGDWHTASFEDLAGDAAAGLHLLLSHPRIDTSRLGVIGFSQGGYATAVLSAEEPACKFTILVSGAVASFMDDMLTELEMEAKNEGAPMSADELQGLRGVYEKVFSFASSKQGWKELQEAAAFQRSRSPRLARGLRTLPHDPTSWVWEWVRRTGNFDPLPYWQRSRVPVLFLFGGKDDDLGVRRGIERLWSSSACTNGNMSILFFGPNGHVLFREDALDFIKRWVIDRGAH